MGDISRVEQAPADILISSVERTYASNLEILKRKNSDYASPENPFLTFEASARMAGVTVEQGLLVRISDKLTRVRNLLTRTSVVDERLEDTIADAINYLAILKAWRERRQL